VATSLQLHALNSSNPAEAQIKDRQENRYGQPSTGQLILPLVSVIVTTKNEEKNIGNCLKAVKQQTFKNLEVIVVDNFSEDRTAQIAEEYGAKVYFKGNERSQQRNYGAELAAGKYIIYLDADMIISPPLIEECCTKCESNLADAFYIPERIVGNGFWIKVRDFERSFYTGTVIDAVRFVRRELFLQIGGFDIKLTGPEDWDFDRKIRQNGTVKVANVPLYHNEGQFNIKRYLKKKRYYSKGIQQYITKWGKNDLETVKQTGVQYRLIGVFVEKGKWKRLLRNLPYTVAMYFLRLRVAVTFIQTSKNSR
jgi:glycosyltransferase involved in cell wall biosynthesis